MFFFQLFFFVIFSFVVLNEKDYLWWLFNWKKEQENGILHFTMKERLLPRESNELVFHVVFIRRE